MANTIRFTVKLPGFPATIPALVVYISFGYLWGMAFSDHIFANFNETHWNNVWVYFWLFLWPFAMAFLFMFYIGGFFLIVGLLYLGYQYFLADRVLRWRHRRMAARIERNSAARRAK
jgi:hypothetical protein